jgi:hypothetical protein
VLRRTHPHLPTASSKVSCIHSLICVCTSLTVHTGYPSFRISSFSQRLEEAFNSHRSFLQRRNNRNSPGCVVLRQCHAYERQRTEGHPGRSPAVPRYYYPEVSPSRYTSRHEDEMCLVDHDISLDSIPLCCLHGGILSSFMQQIDRPRCIIWFPCHLFYFVHA